MTANTSECSDDLEYRFSCNPLRIRLERVIACVPAVVLLYGLDLFHDRLETQHGLFIFACHDLIAAVEGRSEASCSRYRQRCSRMQGS